LTKGSELGRQKNYMPKQPIFYSHKVHAGINQINCLYCHAGAEKSRHAMIPSSNVCMNCHKQINEYTGVDQHPLVDLEGNKVDGTKKSKNYTNMQVGIQLKKTTKEIPQVLY
jgi:predicted CXXCH cytochrome family protein